MVNCSRYKYAHLEDKSLCRYDSWNGPQKPFGATIQSRQTNDDDVIVSFKTRRGLPTGSGSLVFFSEAFFRSRLSIFNVFDTIIRGPLLPF